MSPSINAPSRTQRVLIVDDEPVNRRLYRAILGPALTCEEAGDGLAALEALRQPFDVVLLDVDMPRMDGVEVLRHLREAPPCAHLKIIMMSGRASGDEMAQLMLAGADDYLEKPFSAIQLLSRVTMLLRLKQSQERSDHLYHSLLAFNSELERHLLARDADLVHARNGLVLALAELVAHRDFETGAHLLRLQKFCRALATRAAVLPAFRASIDEHFIDMIECCVPLHDIGKAGLPDHVLLKPGKLDPEEIVVMRTHTTIGAQVLDKVAQRHGFARPFFEMAIDITRHHHERYDGKGYPDQLAGEQIPLAARIVALADVYDALRSRRVYKPAYAHEDALRIMLTESPGHFDPALLNVLRDCADEFAELFAKLAD